MRRYCYLDEAPKITAETDVKLRREKATRNCVSKLRL